VVAKVYKYALSFVNVASWYKEAEPLTSKDCAEVAKAFLTESNPLKWPQLLQFNPERELMGSVTIEM